MIKHPEFNSSNRHGDKLIALDVLQNYSIFETIVLWSKYFTSLGIRLAKPEEEQNIDIPYVVTIYYYGKGRYDIKFYLEREKVDGRFIVTQKVPIHVLSDIEEIIVTDDKNFVDCDVNMGEIYISFDFNEHYMNFIRKARVRCIMHLATREI